MAQSSGKSGNAGSGWKKDDIKPQYFSTKPPKADFKAIKEKLAAGGVYILDFLESIGEDSRIWSKYDPEENTIVCFYSIGRLAKGKPDRIIIGRGSTYLRAIAVVAHWVETLSPETMFPDNDDDDEKW